MTPEQTDDLTKIALWMRARVTEIMRQCSARKQAAECMQNATSSELKAAAELSKSLGSYAVKAMTVKEAKESATRDNIIVGRLEAEATLLTTWANFLEHLASPDQATW